MLMTYCGLEEDVAELEVAGLEQVPGVEGHIALLHVHEELAQDLLQHSKSISSTHKSPKLSSTPNAAWGPANFNDRPKTIIMWCT